MAGTLIKIFHLRKLETDLIFRWKCTCINSKCRQFRPKSHSTRGNTNRLSAFGLRLKKGPRYCYVLRTLYYDLASCLRFLNLSPLWMHFASFLLDSSFQCFYFISISMKHKFQISNPFLRTDMSGLFAGKHALTHIDSLQLNLHSMSGLLQTNWVI